MPVDVDALPVSSNCSLSGQQLPSALPADRLALLVSLRLAYLAVLRVFGWLALLAWSDRAKGRGDPYATNTARRCNDVIPASTGVRAT